jgi:prepilin-type N-terminal cleavage/methylation domain-containing protein
MNKQLRQKGFSLTEVLMATGILAMGLMLVAMAFPVGIKLVSVSTERTIGDAAIGEAVAKMHLYGIKPFNDLSWPANSDSDPLTTVDNTCTDYWRVCGTTFFPKAQDNLHEQDNQHYYPSLVPLKEEDKRYCWSILARRADTNTNQVQTTVLVCRIQGGSAKYYPSVGTTMVDAPVPVKVQVQKIGTGNRQLKIIPALTGSPEYKFFTEGCKIIEDATGHPCRVLELKDVDSDGNRDLILQDDYTGASPGDVWVVPPAVGGSRNPCIRVWQSDLTF